MSTILRPTIIQNTVVSGNGIIQVSGIDRITPLSRQVRNLINIGFTIHGDVSIADTAPIFASDEADVDFWKNSKIISAQTLHEQYLTKNKKPDLAALLAINVADKNLSKNFDQVMQWKDKYGKFCFLYLNDWNGDRGVNVSRVGSGWIDDCSFAGVSS